MPVHRLITLIVFTVMAAYVLARAVLVPLSYDEAASLFRYVRSDFAGLFDFHVATNHLLSSMLTWFSAGVFGESPLALRLPGLLAALSYLTAALALARRAASPMIGVSGFVLLAANPYVLDYLALSRGYGLALALTLGSVYALLRWLDVRPDDMSARRWAARTVWLAAAAVVANFSSLTMFLAVLGVVVLRSWWTQRSRTSTTSRAPHTVVPRWSRATIVTWLILATVFSWLVYSREHSLSQDLFSPITVRVHGLLPEEMRSVHVYRLDSREHARELDRQADGSWRTGELKDAWGLQIHLPVSVDRNLSRLEVAIGPYRFVRDRRQPGPWQVVDINAAERMLIATPGLAAPRPDNSSLNGVINWRDNGHHAWLVAGYTARTIGGLLLLAAVLIAVRFIAVRWGWLPADVTLIVCSAITVVATVTAAPIYVLQHGSQLYFSGAGGLIDGTFGSLARNTMYGARYADNQQSVILLLWTIAAAAGVLLPLLWPRARVSPGPSVASGASVVVRPSAVLALLGLVALQTFVQHQILGTPYLFGRTAIVLLPLLLALTWLTADAVATLGGAVRFAATAAAVVLAILAGAHAFATFNVHRTLDWPDDAATPEMLETVIRDATANGDTPRAVSLGTEWMYLPVARYYAERMSTAAIRVEVQVAPMDGPAPDYLYLTRTSTLGSQETQVQRFPDGRGVLWRINPDVD
ncbi:MAG: hypothetical protein IT178_01875 [Acidobacteria bacterium]|nr:hypothetical protein [Acidobacteriota bacterium]